MLTKNFARLQTEVASHVAADSVAQRSYKACFIGCLAGGVDDPEYIENTYGIPPRVTRLAESIFEGLLTREAVAFFAAFPDAIACDGKNLGRVIWQFLAAELRALPAVSPEVQAVIDSVAQGLDLLSGGGHWLSAAEAAEAAEAAAEAAYAYGFHTEAAAAAAAHAAAAHAANPDATTADVTTAADHAAHAADLAANAANFAVSVTVSRRQRDLLLRLISEAPVNALI